MTSAMFRIALAISFSFAPAFASGARGGNLSTGTAASGNSAFDKSAEARLSRDLQSGFKTLSRTTRLYNYFNYNRPPDQLHEELKTSAGRAGFVRRYIETATDNFWNFSFRADQYANAGGGVYLAIDPYHAYAQRIFGTNLIELTFPQGAPFLSVVRPLAISSETLSALIAEGYFAKHQAQQIFFKIGGPTGLGFYRNTLKVMTWPGYERFRALVHRIFQTRGIEFIEYTWDSSLNGFCPRKSASAFVFFGRRPHDGRFDGTPMISSDMNYPELSNEERARSDVSFRFRSVLSRIVELRKRGALIPRGLIVPNTFTAQEYQRLKSVTYGCD